MISQENEELTTYVYELIDEKLKKDANLLLRVQDIPNSGLRALIYAKLSCLSQEYNINLIISISVNTKILDSIDSKTNVDMCKVLGVLLDNAIEATSATEKKLIGVSLYIENNIFNIIISNSFTDTLDFDKIDMITYSTNGKNRGCGLPLAKIIINSNKKLKILERLMMIFFHKFCRFVCDFCKR